MVVFRGGGAVLHPTSSVVELNSAVSSNVNVVYDQQPVSTMGEQGDSTAMNRNTAAIPDIYICY